MGEEAREAVEVAGRQPDMTITGAWLEDRAEGVPGPGVFFTLWL